MHVSQDDTTELAGELVVVGVAPKQTNPNPEGRSCLS